MSDIDLTDKQPLQISINRGIYLRVMGKEVLEGGGGGQDKGKEDGKEISRNNEGAKRG